MIVKKIIHSKALYVLTLFAVSFIVITICSKSSPLYPLNDWDDANCFFTVGKAAANGRVLYRDIFEQKGPILYMLHSAAYLISHNTFVGVYLIELAASSLFLHFSYKIIELFSEKSSFLYIMPVAVFTYTSLAFCSGDSAEELCLPMLLFVLYTGLESWKRKCPLGAVRMFICGICTGLILWIKFTMLGFIIGFAAAFVILYIREKDYKLIMICTISMTAGIITASLPVIIYFAVNDSFQYLWEVYFYDNIFLYSTGSVLPPVIKQIVNLLWGLVSFAAYNTFALIMLIAAFYSILKMKDKTLLLIFSAIVLSGFLFSFVGGRAYAYYSLTMSVFSPVGIVWTIEFIKQKKAVKISGKRKKALLYCVCLFLTFLLNRNSYSLFADKNDMPQFRFNSIISEKSGASLLNYGFLDGGFYTVTGIVPDCRFFCGLNIELPELKETQDKYISSGQADFIITKDEKPEFPGYVCIDKCEYMYWSSKSTYYLYSKTGQRIAG